MDFMSDSLANGAKFRTFNVMDDYNREGLTIEVGLSLPSTRVIRALEQVIEWRGKPVYIVRRTPESLTAINDIDNSILRDADSVAASQPSYVSGSARTQAGREEYLILVGLCTHLGCAPMYRPDVGAVDLGGDSWLGGFFCPCHGSKFDLSGRVFAGVPAPTNLEVPPHSYESDDIVIIGIDAEIA